MAEMRSRIGQILVREGIIEAQVAQKAAEIQAQNPGRKFGEILVQDLGVSHHAVFSQLARIYAFKEYDFESNGLDEAGIAFIRETLPAKGRSGQRAVGPPDGPGGPISRAHPYYWSVFVFSGHGRRR